MVNVAKEKMSSDLAALNQYGNQLNQTQCSGCLLYTSDRVGCFKFSPVEGAPATEMADQVPEDVKEERFHRFMQLQQEISAERLKQKIGQTLGVIVDEIDDEGVIGRTKADAPEVDGLVYIENLSGTPVKVGEFIKVTITHSDEYDLWGTC